MWNILIHFWEKLSFSFQKELTLNNEINNLKTKLKESEEKNKILSKSNLELEEKNKKLVSELEIRKSLKDYLREKKILAESHYEKFTPNFEGNCSFTKEVEMIFSLLDLFTKEFLQANSSKEKIFRDDVALTENFFSLNYPSANSIKTASKSITARVCIIRIRFQGVVKGNYEKIGKSGINKLFFLNYLLDEYIQMHVMETLDEYFTCLSYSYFKNKSTTQALWLISLLGASETR